MEGRVRVSNKDASENIKLTVVVMLVRAVGVAPLWKDSAVFCILASQIPAHEGFRVCAGMSLRARLPDVVGEKS